MILFELLALIVLAAFVANGLKAGAIEALGRFIGAVLGFLAAKAWSGWFITALSLFMPLTWASLVAFIVVFLVVDHFVGFIFKFAETILGVFEKLPVIKQLSSIIGAVLGFLEGVVVIGGTASLLRVVAGPVGAAQTVISLNVVKGIEGLFKILLGFLL
jgi:uncharacterized membrane protein required for colicin V production